MDLTSAEKVAKLAWPEASFLPSASDQTAFIRENVGSHWTFFLGSPIDIRRAEQAILRNGWGAQYGRALATALTAWPWPDEETSREITSIEVAHLAIASTEIRAKALLALADKLTTQ